MAEIKPLRAWRYHPRFSKQIEEYTSPLFDVITEEHRRMLYENPYNSIHLSVPRDVPPYENVARRLESWKQEGILVHDMVPAIYVYYQYFSLPGIDKTFCRKGFIANIKAYDWDERVVLRHENTIPQSVEDRLEMLRHTRLNVAPTHGLYTDPSHRLEPLMDEAMQAPLYETEDYQGVVDKLAVIHDAEAIRCFIDLMRDKQVILADGHHRYSASLAYRKERMRQNPHHSGHEPYNYHLMYFTNTEADDIRILPTHRLISGLKNFDLQSFCVALEPYFTIKPVADPYTLQEVITGKPWAFGVILPGRYLKIRLKPELAAKVEELVPWDFPALIKRLDLTVLHALVIENALGIPGKEQAKSENIQYTRSLGECVDKVRGGEAQLALINREISIETVKEVCYSGYTLPQKSTYFYPKVVCGFLFGSVHDDEFNALADRLFS
ncbi:DUF1015 domain-containing protein [Thermonema rossianum]|uniref:DUF1015 domain-containing protein n=1 Tax=Thermonema rossianum TaxID=55505 RepID=UPI00056E860E|nr:DUF1015 domain-containing protein [Thermonema rossianum]